MINRLQAAVIKRIQAVAFLVLRNRLRATVMITVAMALLGGLGLSQLNVSSNLLHLLPDHHPEVSKYKRTMEAFDPLNRIFFSIKASSEDHLIEIGDDLALALEQTQLFSEIKYRWNPDEIFATVAAMTNHRAALFSQEAEQQLTQALATSQIHATLAEWKKTLIENPAPFLSQTFSADPIGIHQFLFEKLTFLQSFGQSLHTNRGRLFSKDQERLLIMAYPIRPPNDSKFSEQLTDAVDQIIGNLQSGNATVAWLGAHRFARHNEADMKQGVGLATTISLVGIILLAFLVFRRPLLPLIALGPVVFAGFTALAIVPWIFDRVTLVAIGIGSILFGLAIDYSVHILFHLDAYDDIDEKAIRKTLNHVTVPLSLSALTSVAAFVCLQASQLPTYQQFGAIAAFGIGGAWLFSLVFVPAFAAATKPARTQPALRLERFILPALQFVNAHRRPILFGLIVVSVLAMIGVTKVKTDGDLKNLYLTDGPIKSDMEIVNRSFGNAMQSTTLVINASTLAEALEGNDQLWTTLSQLKDAGTIDDFFSLAPFLPSFQQQQQNIERWQQFWDTARLERLQRDLGRAGQALGMKPDAFIEFLDDISSESHAVLSVGSYAGTPIAALLDSQIDQSDGVKILANARVPDSVTNEHFLGALDWQGHGLDVVNAQQFVRDMIKLITDDLHLLAGGAIFSVILLLSTIHGPAAAAYMITPLLVSLVWTFGLMGWLGIPINVMNSIIVLLIFGLVIDYSVFLTNALLTPGSQAEFIGRASGAIAVSAFTTIAAVGALRVAEHPALRVVGATTLIGISCGFLAVMLILPLSLYRPQGLPR